MNCFGKKVTSRAASALTMTLLLVGLAACEEEQVEKAEVIRPVRAIKVADASNFERRWFSGRAKGTKELDLSFRVSGPLTQRKVDVGSEVKKGDVIARIDPATFKADADRAQADVARAKAALANAVEQLKRKKILVAKGHEAKAVLDRFDAIEKEARASVAATTAQLKRKRLDLGYTTLRAPFTGVIVKTYAENFEDVRPKQSIVRLVDNSRIEMVVDIPENLISQAHLVKEVVVIFDPFPDLKIPATVKEIGTEASETTRTYPVTIIMDQPKDVKILPGMAGKSTRKKGPLQQGDKAQIIVPETAILTKGDVSKTYVWIVDEAKKTVSAREVKTGNLTNQGYSVSGGLTPGEWIVTAGVNYLRDGQKVRLLEQ